MARSKASRSWWNRTVLGASLASLCSDASHEMATAVLPKVLVSIGGGAGSLGIIEGLSDGISVAAKLASGVLADRVERRKPLASIGYLVTALATGAIGLCTAWWQALACRIAAWLGRGSRGPAKYVLVADSTTDGRLGRAFGVERGADAVGAVIGPLAALVLTAHGTGVRAILFLSLVPGILAFLAMMLVVVEKHDGRRRARERLWVSLTSLGKPYRRYLLGISLYGCGDFARSLLILYASQHARAVPFGWSKETFGIALYVLHNAVTAVASFPIGFAADRIGRRPTLAAGYVLGGLTLVAFALLPPTASVLALLFSATGVYTAGRGVCEKAAATEVLPEKERGAGLGILAAANGLGDTLSSAMVGGLWHALPALPAAGFLLAAALQLAGALVVALFVKRR